MGEFEQGFNVGSLFIAIMGLVFGVLYYNCNSTDYSSVVLAREVCLKYNSDLEKIYNDLDFKCTNGAFFDRVRIK